MPPKLHLQARLIQEVKNYTTTNVAEHVKTLDEYIQTQALAERVSYYVIHNRQVHPTAMRLYFHVDQINMDPELYIEQYLKNVKDLQALVEYAADHYHNAEGVGLTDNTFDALEYHLKKELKKQKLKYDKIGAEPIKRIRCVLEYPMSSLSKIKPNEKKCTQFLTENWELVWSLKLNGVSGAAHYLKGKLVKLNTRGNGTIGGDISNLIPHLQIPLTVSEPCDIVVRGEFIMTKAKVLEYKCGDGRAFVSGKINSGFVSPNLKDIQFVAYELMHSREAIAKPSMTLPHLTTLGFTVVDFGTLMKATTYDIIKLYMEKRSSAIYDIDGLVLTINKPGPFMSQAFKMPLASQMRKTKVVNVEWDVSRLGRYCPVVVYKPIYLNDTRLTRATGHNAKHIVNWGITKDTDITIVRSGDIIPQVKSVDGNTGTPILPTTTYSWHWDKCDIVLDDIDNNKNVQIKRIYHYFKTIALKQFGEKTAEYFYDVGLTTPEKAIYATAKDFQRIKNVGPKKAESFVNNIVKALNTISPDRLMNASSKKKCHMGKKSLKLLFRAIPDILLLSAETLKKRLGEKKIPGFGPAKMKMIPEIIETFNLYLHNYDPVVQHRVRHYYVETSARLDAEGRNTLIKGKKFVFPSFVQDEEQMDKIEDYIFDHRGTIVKQVSSDVAAVIYGQVSDVTDKMRDADQLGIDILTMDEFLVRYGIKI